MTTVQPKGRVRLYAAGGCGMNIGSQLENHRNRNETAFANLDIVYVDTSKSNLKPNIDPENCYLLEGLDGSGKVRSENHEQISKHIRAILQRFEPADLNIVLSSAAGGSGSVIAPLLASELLANDAPTVIIAIGAASTKIDADNTLKTLKSYSAISTMRNAPVILSYAENGPEVSRSEADAVAVSTIMALCVLFSRENHELDSKDLFHWLHYQKTTSFPVQLTSLTLVEKKSNIDGLGNVISVATLATGTENTSLSNMPEYQCVGYVSAAADDAITSRSPMHFVISDGVLPNMAKKLKAVIDKFETSSIARDRGDSILGNATPTTQTGLVI